MRIVLQEKGVFLPIEIGCIETISYKDNLLEIKARGNNRSIPLEDIKELRIYEY